ncbi:MAG: serine--tRNA ligase [Flavobacteriaceae bacterium]|nr:serine--tRNA ligase [Flavobacteriaceae bacterium]MCY4217444.1 serine--tRNA ligase [Flavobacteriaceae bacterium]MCY4254242.1 serine--tRNA ligase [Flavobacteriaceae bacterium]
MLSIQYIRDHLTEVNQGLKKRDQSFENELNEILLLDSQKRKIQTQLNQLQADVNSSSDLIARLFKNNETQKAQELIKKNADLKDRIKDLKNQFQQKQKKIDHLLVQIPNVPHNEVPFGKNEEDNVEIFRHGEIPFLNLTALPHWDIVEKNDFIQFENGAKLTEKGFPVYVSKMARLQRALINFFIDSNTGAGYKEYAVPLLVNEQSAFGTGQLPDKDQQMYHIQEDKMYLIPTSEVPLTNLYRNAYLKESDLPIKMTSYTPCFRREAGSYGSDVRGLNRLHQFDKVEIVRIEKPQNSSSALQEMIDHVKKLLELLELPYRILKLCGTDLGFAASITFDFEVYSAAQKKWLEVSSVSNFESFQANRLKLRYRDQENNRHFLHTLNGSALALPRILACMIENFQATSCIHIPKAIRDYTGFDVIEFSP